MNGAWFQRADWPMEWEIARRRGIMDAIMALPSRRPLSEEEIEAAALQIFAALSIGINEAEPHNRQASSAVTEKEIRKLHKLTGALADHIDAMHRPAVAGMFAEGCDLWTLVERLRAAQEAAVGAIDHVLTMAGPSLGRRTEPLKAEITAAAKMVFESITGQRATHTNYASSGVGGLWPEFLQEVFEALRVKASVPSQVRAR